MMTKPTTRPTPLWQQVVAIGVYLFGSGLFALGLILMATDNFSMFWDILFGMFQFVAWALGLVTLVAGLYWLVFRVLPHVRPKGTEGEHRVPRKAHLVTRIAKPVPPMAQKGTPSAQPVPSMLLDMGGGRMKRSDMVTQADITDLITRAKKEEAVTWREQLLELHQSMAQPVPVAHKVVPEVVDIEEQVILEWLTGITPDGGASYPLKAQRNVQAFLKAYRAKQRAEGWRLVRAPSLPHRADVSVPEDFDRENSLTLRSTAQHGTARSDTVIVSTVQHGTEGEYASEEIQNEHSSGGTQERQTEVCSDTDSHRSETGNGETEGCSSEGTVGEDGRVQFLLPMGETVSKGTGSVPL